MLNDYNCGPVTKIVWNTQTNIDTKSHSDMRFWKLKTIFLPTKTLKSGGLVGCQVCIPRSNADVNTCLRMGFGICLPVSVGSVLPFLLHPVLLTVNLPCCGQSGPCDTSFSPLPSD